MFSPNKEFRPDIQGLRAIGAFLIMVFHLWIPKVSGGVDVFFVISGYLMTQVFLDLMNRDGFNPLKFWTNIMGRIVPLAYLVMVLTAIASYAWVAPIYWSNALSHFWSAALQVENWNLIEGQVAYLQRDQLLSPFQQYWALSLQMQFYVVLPFVLGGLRLAYETSGRNPKVVFGLLGLGWLASFGYAVWLADSHPSGAYFHTGARAWEFITGVTLAFVGSLRLLGARLANWLAAGGIVVLLLTGILLPGDARFPSWPALMPVLAATCVILAGAKATSPWFSWIRTPWLVKQGSYGFSTYLWHWPILVFMQSLLAQKSLGVTEGLCVIGLTLVLSRLSYLGIEQPLRKMFMTHRPWLPWALAGSLITSTAGLAYGGGKAFYEYMNPVIPETSLPVAPEPNPRLKPAERLDEIQLRKIVTARTDVTKAVLNSCDLGNTSDKVVPCEFGDTKAAKTIVIVGGSHASQWVPAFDVLGKTRGFRLISITKSACTLGLNIENDPGCERWNDAVMKALFRIKPSLVVTVATRMPYLDEPDGREYIPSGYIEKWIQLDKAGIPVLGLRDTPYFEMNPYTCAWINEEELDECARRKADIYLPANPAKVVEQNLKLFRAADLSDLFCPSGKCPSVIDGIPLWRDNHHLTRSFMRHIALRVGDELNVQLPGLLPDELPKVEGPLERAVDVAPSKLPELAELEAENAEMEAQKARIESELSERAMPD